jgi:AraC-like DNA-binding protein
MDFRDKRRTLCDMNDREFHDLREKTFWRLYSFGRTEVAPRERYRFENLPRRPAGSVVFQLNLKGHILYEDAGGAVESGPGDAVLFAYGEESAYGRREPFEEPYVCEFMNLVGAGLAEHWALLRRRHGSVLHLGGETPLRAAMHRLWATAEPRTRLTEAERAAAVLDFVMRLFSHLGAQWASARSPVERAVEDLVSNPGYSRGLKEVARQHGCSREHLARVFRARMGCPAKEYLLKARLGRALDLLRETHLPLAQVAEQSGFGTPHRLSRHVRAATGHPPLRWRRSGARNGAGKKTGG